MKFKDLQTGEFFKFVQPEDVVWEIEGRLYIRLYDLMYQDSLTNERWRIETKARPDPEKEIKCTRKSENNLLKFLKND